MGEKEEDGLLPRACSSREAETGKQYRRKQEWNRNRQGQARTLPSTRSI